MLRAADGRSRAPPLGDRRRRRHGGRFRVRARRGMPRRAHSRRLAHARGAVRRSRRTRFSSASPICRRGSPRSPGRIPLLMTTHLRSDRRQARAGPLLPAGPRLGARRRAAGDGARGDRPPRQGVRRSLRAHSAASPEGLPHGRLRLHDDLRRDRALGGRAPEPRCPSACSRSPRAPSRSAGRSARATSASRSTSSSRPGAGRSIRTRSAARSGRPATRP